MDQRATSTMDQKTDWKSQIEEVVAKQALAMNYEYGITCRVTPTRSEAGTHTLGILLDLTHSSQEFDLEWTATFTDHPDDGVQTRLLGPESVGRTLSDESHRTLDDLRRGVAGLPYVVQGFFSGRASRGPAPVTVPEAIQGRRSIKRFTNRPVPKEQIEELIAAAVQAPNHRLTQPWRFYVLGPEARQAYGTALGKRKARKAADAEQARQVTDKVAQEHRDLPAMIAVSVIQAEDPEVREEDYAASYMAIENLALAAQAMGLGTHVKTGAVMSDPEARAAVGASDAERIVATIHLGQPAEQPAARARKSAAEVTVWRP
jgi:nitroreductase